jgi:hypothetical protein
MNEGKTSARSKVAKLAALGTAVALLGVSLGVYIPQAANAAPAGSKMMTGKKGHKGGKKGHKGGKKSKKGSMGGTTPPPK